jgi:hypothetical protein
MPQIFGIAVVAHLPIITFLAIEATGKWVMMVSRAFAPGSIFAFVRWASSDYGTSRIGILRAVEPDERCPTIPYMRPGGAILLPLSGWPKVTPQ